MGEVQHHPHDYKIAFSFRDMGVEVDVFADVIKRYARLPVARMLEIGCRPASHASEISKRGYADVGLDCRDEMLAYARNQAKTISSSVTFVWADMKDFCFDEPVDFAFVLLGSLYVQRTPDLQAHFDVMSQVLNQGGLYLLDWCINFASHTAPNVSWEMTKDNILW
ncbi:hypothetical protein NKDENANG_02031 [Candidatus Entotheonellaceae bacterium PAL068K]